MLSSRLGQLREFTLQWYRSAQSCLLASRIFKTLWGVVKPWLNEATLSKIQILGSDYHVRSRHACELRD